MNFIRNCDPSKGTCPTVALPPFGVLAPSSSNMSAAMRRAQVVRRGGTSQCNTGGGTGPRGPAGPAGFDGVNGLDGLDGRNGTDGIAGRDGINGLPGRDGTNGINGLPGINGTNGFDGPTGPAGPSGPAGPAGPTGESGATLLPLNNVWTGTNTFNLGIQTSSISAISSGTLSLSTPFTPTYAYPIAAGQLGSITNKNYNPSGELGPIIIPSESAFFELSSPMSLTAGIYAIIFNTIIVVPTGGVFSYIRAFLFNALYEQQLVFDILGTTAPITASFNLNIPMNGVIIVPSAGGSYTPVISILSSVGVFTSTFQHFVFKAVRIA